jgi:hypothetical protein
MTSQAVRQAGWFVLISVVFTIMLLVGVTLWAGADELAHLTGLSPARSAEIGQRMFWVAAVAKLLGLIWSGRRFFGKPRI